MYLMKRDYIDFQSRNTPLAYLISFRTYGTWLHGDERGSVDRRKYNVFKTAKIPVSLNLQNQEISLLKHQSITLNGQQRKVVEDAVREVCAYRNYKLFAIQVRTNHVHIVTFGVGKPELLMNSFKAYSTRYLREKKLTEPALKLWSRHGSTRYLWTEEQIETAIDYVLNGQGDKLPDF